MDTLGPANFGIISLFYRGCLLSELILYCHGPVGTTQLVLYTEGSTVLCLLFRGSFERGTIVLSLLNSSIILSNKTITFEMVTALLRSTSVVTMHTAHLPIVCPPIGSDYPMFYLSKNLFCMGCGTAQRQCRSCLCCCTHLLTLCHSIGLSNL